MKPKPAPNFVRAWRLARGLTLEQLAERVGVSHATIQRIETQKQRAPDYLFDALAEALGTDKASLHMRDPSDPEGIWAIWDEASPLERRQIVELAKTVIRMREAS
jgi:transcriptional regulator with XRE-family HTH domain